MTDSILESVKKVLGIGPTDDSFDLDIIMHINSAFSVLHQLGLGPDAGFMIEGSDETWEQFTEKDATLNAVKTYMYLKVRLVFDPPATSFAITAMENQIKEHEWRLNVRREEVKYPWSPPSTPSSPTME